ncbi:hypothetical protein OG206_21440 [Streptomyces sp. NBC_01341]|uniref:DUF6584 family protein n=1 Tax=Streptomyces sp. NBC_01341 TaxID=2903831 RepID=UPI002E0D548D|nr:hypothetical protein OG206_21440 [Streptomyces sp. NBC_01341]
MALTDTLARVDGDLAAGRIPMARQRLRGLVSSFPHDHTLRRRLAEVYRLYGDPAEAGRWMYLEQDRSADETAAFDARYTDPVRRMRALAWRGPEAAAGSAFAVGELASARRSASASAGRALDWDTLPDTGNGTADDGSFGQSLAALGCLAVTLVFLAIWVNGLVGLFD